MDTTTSDGSDSPRFTATWSGISLRVFGKRLVLHPNVHGILAVSSLFLAAFLAGEMWLGHLSALVFAEVMHFLGWAWLELPEFIALSE